jgi:uncharacterized protein YcnI
VYSVPHTRRLRISIGAVLSAAAVLVLGGPAWAHIHPDPPAVEAGKPATVGFGVEHGCDTSPTTEVSIQLPAGSTAIKGIDGDGFTSKVDGEVVTFSGGPLPATKEKAFTVSFTPPDKPGDALVKIVQTCENGSLSWIEVTPPGGEEPDHPAPVLKLTDGPPTAADLQPEADPDADAGAGAGAGEHGHDAAAPASTSSEHAGSDSSDDSSNAPLIAGVVAAVVVVGGGALLLFRSRRS